MRLGSMAKRTRVPVGPASGGFAQQSRVQANALFPSPSSGSYAATMSVVMQSKCRVAVVARAKATRRPHETDLSKLPPELQTYYTETTKNLVELNRARMKALEDLKAARSRISELGK
jgi:hypothetical protein